MNRMFKPSESQIQKAEKILKAYEVHSVKGIGAFEVDGSVVDLPVIKWAHDILSKSKK